jgi:nucleoside-diphosphate-sugar epimerase
MTVLVTGASGFVGAHILEALVAAGHDRIVATDIAPAPGDLADPRIVRLPLDVCNGEAVRAVMEAWRPALVVHAAAITPNPDEEIRDAARIMAVNTGGSANVVAAALATGSTTRIVLFSSSGVYSGQVVYPDRLRETDPLPSMPSSLYAVTKLACEGLAHRVAASGQTSICAVRVAAVYGEHERATESRKAARISLIHRLALATAHGGAPVKLSGPNLRRDWVHGYDVGRAVAALLAAPRLDHVIYNIASGEVVGLHDLAGMFRAEGLATSDETGAIDLGLRPEDDRPPIDISRIVRDAGFQPSVSLADGVRALIAFHRKNRPA